MGLVLFVWLSHAVYVQEGSWPVAVCCVYRWSRGTGLHRTSDLIALSLFSCPNHICLAEMTLFWQCNQCSGLEDHGLSDCNSFAASFGLAEVVPPHEGLGGFSVLGVILWKVVGFLSLFVVDAVISYWQHLELACFGCWGEPGTDLLLTLMSCTTFFFSVFTADSTWPFALLWCGDVVVCSMPHFFVKDLNSLDVNCGLLSVTNCLEIS